MLNLTLLQAPLGDMTRILVDKRIPLCEEEYSALKMEPLL